MSGYNKDFGLSVFNNIMKISIIAFITLSILSNNICCQTPEAANVMAGFYIEGEIESIAAHLYFPPNCEKSDERLDRLYSAKLLYSTFQVLGRSEGMYISDSVKELGYFGITLGFQACWDGVPTSRIYYLTEFQNAGPGFIVVELAEYGKLLVIKTFGVGLRGDDTKRRWTEIMTQINNLVNEGWIDEWVKEYQSKIIPEA